MGEETRPLSELVAQGWEIQDFSTAYTGCLYAHTVLLKRQRQHKIVVIRKRPVLGIAISELDV